MNDDTRSHGFQASLQEGHFIMKRGLFMKKNIVISYDEEKLCALRLFAEQKGICLEDELSETLDGLYQKHVPANVRSFLDMKSESHKLQKARAASVPVVGD